MRDISNTAEILDSRDVEERIDEIESEQSSLIDEYVEAKEEEEELREEDPDRSGPTERLSDAINALASFWDRAPEEIDDAVEAMGIAADGFNGDEELATLLAFRDEVRQATSEWNDGVTLIHEDYFTEYAEELAGDIGAIDPDAKWPLNHIDWDAAANELKIDYSYAEFDGETYWFRQS